MIYMLDIYACLQMDLAIERLYDLKLAQESASNKQKFEEKINEEIEHFNSLKNNYVEKHRYSMKFTIGKAVMSILKQIDNNQSQQKAFEFVYQYIEDLPEWALMKLCAQHDVYDWCVEKMKSMKDNDVIVHLKEAYYSENDIKQRLHIRRLGEKYIEFLYGRLHEGYGVISILLNNNGEFPRVLVDIKKVLDYVISEDRLSQEYVQLILTNLELPPLFSIRKHLSENLDQAALLLSFILSSSRTNLIDEGKKIENDVSRLVYYEYALRHVDNERKRIMLAYLDKDEHATLMIALIQSMPLTIEILRMVMEKEDDNDDDNDVNIDFLDHVKRNKDIVPWEHGNRNASDYIGYSISDMMRKCDVEWYELAIRSVMDYGNDVIIDKMKLWCSYSIYIPSVNRIYRNITSKALLQNRLMVIFYYFEFFNTENFLNLGTVVNVSGNKEMYYMIMTDYINSIDMDIEEFTLVVGKSLYGMMNYINKQLSLLNE